MKQFEWLKINKPKKSVFDLSHERKLTAKIGKLYPVLLQEVIPGDQFSVRTESLVRLMPMIAPVMHRMNIYIHYFYVPYRIIWNDWEEYITGGENGTSVINHPKVYGQGVDWRNYYQIGDLLDHLGFPEQIDSWTGTGQFEVSQLPFRAINLIWNDYYRDQNFQPKLKFPKDSVDSPITVLNNGTLGTDMLTLKTRNWEKDYFTSSLPWTQRGNPVMLPLGSTAPVKWPETIGDEAPYEYASGNPVTDPTNNPISLIWTEGTQGGMATAGGMVNPKGWYADLSEATASSINDLRRAFSLQRWLEKNARGGSRYIENVLNHFGVKVPDSRLQRPEYLGGGKFPIQISEVLSSYGADDAGDPLGTMGGHGVSGGMSNGFKSYHTEHGLIIGLLSIMPRTAYQNGLPKLFTKFDKFDLYWPDFAHIGEQPVKNSEVFLSQPNGDNNDQTWGYQARYQEYRMQNDSIHGEFRTTLDNWHMARKFTNLPTLSSQFVTVDSDYRQWPVSIDTDKFLIQLYHNIRAIRHISKEGNPI